VAEGVGFEPTVSFPTLVFKTRSFGRSDTLPSTTLAKTGYDGLGSGLGLLVFAKTTTLGLIQDHLTQAHALRGDFHRFVIGNKFQGLL